MSIERHVNVSEELHDQAQTRAQALGLTLKAFVEDAVREALRTRKPKLEVVRTASTTACDEQWSLPPFWEREKHHG